DTIDTQEKLCELLQKEGFTVNQVKISRLLHKIGAIKMSEGDKIVYRLPVEGIKLSTQDTLKQLVTSITHNEYLVVIQTTPGAAQLVAKLLDLAQYVDVLGTVAGDDTIFVTPTTLKKTTSVYQSICQNFQ
ncbi:MAG: hypothetical protein A3E82_05700, partial [Gammaproteobacteria bacterium RIFCSPHIGHO2_12_FULL_38_11]